MSTTDMDIDEAYETVTEQYDRISNLQQVSRHLNWDQQVMMPEGGTPARARQSSTVRSLTHDLITDEALGTNLDRLEDGDLDDEQEAVVREIRRQYDRAANVPDELVQELSQLQAEAQQSWQEAKAADEFEAYAPTLTELRDLHVERAQHIDSDRSPYEVLYEEGQPYIPLDRMEDLFDELREGLVPLIDDIRNSDVEPAWPIEGTYDEQTQRALCDDVLDFLGYDRTRGRLDTAPHPFMSGNQFDARITTRFKESDPLDALTATMHEFGHAKYQLGLPQDQYGSPLGEPRSAGVHESQSRFYENHVGRTRAFWETFQPTFAEQFPRHDDVSAEELYQAVNKVRPDNVIRVEADEVTYHMHIILRSEIGKGFLEGDIGVEEIPGIWNDKMDEYLGVRPETDAEGCLQDIHWTRSFAVFHGYTIGSVLAAQLDAAMREDLDVDALIRKGDLDPIHEWLEERIHQHACRYTTQELIEQATGEPLTAEYYLEYVEDKFGDLYDL